jgi:arylsulfatase A-like enzyme
MKSTLPVIGLGVFSAGINTPLVHAQKTNEHPNIILILADDMGYSDIGCYGSEISTPNIDKLSSEGLQMTQFYNASRSCPSRASLLTGLYQHEAGIGLMVDNMGYPGYEGYLNNRCVTLAEALKANGYHTYMSGKWHVGGDPNHRPKDRGFEHYFGLLDGASNYFQLIPYRTNQAAPRMMDEDVPYFPKKDSFYMTNAITDHAIKFIENEKNQETPFFLYLAYTAPHWPLNALPEDIAKYRGKYLKGWDELRKERFKKMASLGIIDTTVIKLSPRDEHSCSWDSLSEKDKDMWDLRMAVYAAMVDRMDQNIGKLLKKLEETGEKENTVIIFLSDNGGCHEKIKDYANYVRMPGETGSPESLDSYEFNWANLSNTPFRMFKHWVNEGGISTPFIAWNPHYIKHEKDNQVGHIIDIMPTLLDLAQGKYPKNYNGNTILPMEGTSLLPVFEGKKLKRKQPVFFEHMGNRAVRDGKWKLVSRYDEENKRFLKWELYDMENDRSELHDVSQKYSDITIKLILKYEDWAKRVGVVSKETIDLKKSKNE